LARVQLSMSVWRDPVQAARAPDQSVARGAERLGDLGRDQQRRDACTGLGLNPAGRRSPRPPRTLSSARPSLFPRRGFAPGWCLGDRVILKTPNEAWAECRHAHYLVCRVCETRSSALVRRGASRRGKRMADIVERFQCSRGWCPNRVPARTRRSFFNRPRDACAMAAVMVMETDHETASHARDYRRCRVID
jgi:hypothetical protein